MLRLMLGTFINAGAILVGGLIGLTGRRFLSTAMESWFKVVLAAFTVFCGLRLIWQGLGGSPGEVVKQIILLMLALVLGNLAGRGLRLQQRSNRLGEKARERIEAAAGKALNLPDAGFKTCAALFCAAPLGIVGAIVEGLSTVPQAAGTSDTFGPLAIKAAMDGLAAVGFARLFGWGVLLSPLPVLAFQGTISLLCSRLLGPQLAAPGLINSVDAAGGLVVVCVALVMLGLKRVPLADYLPALAVAPLLARWWGW